jgi:hypothetical protein
MARQHSDRSKALNKTSRNKLSTRRRDLYLTTHNIPNRQTCIPPAGFFFTRLLYCTKLEIKHLQYVRHVNRYQHSINKYTSNSFEPVIPGSKRPHFLFNDTAATEIYTEVQITVLNSLKISVNIFVKNKYHLRWLSRIHPKIWLVIMPVTLNILVWISQINCRYTK